MESNGGKKNLQQQKQWNPKPHLVIFNFLGSLENNRDIFQIDYLPFVPCAIILYADAKIRICIAGQRKEL